MTTKSGWIETPDQYRNEVWGNTVRSLKPHGGIKHTEFVNFKAGLALLLACDGDRRTGGCFRIFYLAPHQPISEITDTLSGLPHRHFVSPALDWSGVQTDLLWYLQEYLDVDSPRTPPKPPKDTRSFLERAKENHSEVSLISRVVSRFTKGGK